MWMRRHNRKHTSVIKNHPARSVMTCQCPPWEPFLRLWKALAPSSGHCHMHSPPLPLYFHFNSVGPATVIILFPQLIHIERDSNRARGGRQQCTSWHVQRAARLDWWLVQEDLGTEVTHITITAKKSVFILRLVVFFFMSARMLWGAQPRLHWPLPLHLLAHYNEGDGSIKAAIGSRNGPEIRRTRIKNKRIKY